MCWSNSHLLRTLVKILYTSCPGPQFGARGFGHEGPAEAAANHSPTRPPYDPSSQSRPGPVAPLPPHPTASFVPASPGAPGAAPAAGLPASGPATSAQLGPGCMQVSVYAVCARACVPGPPCLPQERSGPGRQAQALHTRVPTAAPSWPGQSPRKAPWRGWSLIMGWGLRVSTRTGQWSSSGPTFPSWAAVFLALSRFLAFAQAASLTAAFQIPAPNELRAFLPDLPWRLHPL